MDQGKHVRFLIIILIIGVSAAGFVLFALTKAKPIIIEKEKIVEKTITKEIIREPTSTAQQAPETHTSFAQAISQTNNRDIITPSTSAQETNYQITNGTKHSIPLEKILAGGPPKDGIPSIDNPLFTSITDANPNLREDGIGISVTIGQTTRFYPFQILVWHEIVNDHIEENPVLVTYCPLCGTGIVFDPTIEEKRVEFGTSGKLYQSNLLMYDRKTDTYWSQVLGEAVVGKLTGQKLRKLPYQIMKYSDWKNTHPNGQVLSTNTGFKRDYNNTPYQGYENSKTVFFPIDESSDVYHPKMPTYGIEVDGFNKAYTIEELDKSTAEFTDTIGNTTITVLYNTKTKTATFIDASTKKEIVPTYGFWFSWFSVHPDTGIYTAN